MLKKLPIGAAIATVLLLSACQSTQQTVQGKEDLLSAAGFSIKPANSAARLAAMKKLPPHKFVQQTSGTNVVWLYADPTICQCVYFGDQTAWANYRAMVFQKQIANEQQMTAIMNQNSFDFGPW
ncbi:hypothetical protein SAMN05519104_1071 [Rhizobiales bacterium GAS188]|nr:hypothetical protein SAMN05519104_1071 [Rhizobiales bacterium GAS188]